MTWIEAQVITEKKSTLRRPSCPSSTLSSSMEQGRYAKQSDLSYPKGCLDQKSCLLDTVDAHSVSGNPHYSRTIILRTAYRPHWVLYPVLCKHSVSFSVLLSVCGYSNQNLDWSLFGCAYCNLYYILGYFEANWHYPTPLPQHKRTFVF